MKSFTLCIFILAAISYSSKASWVLSWSDEFNGNDVDQSKWSFQQGNNNGWGNNEKQYYTSNNHVVSNGMLTIEAKKESMKGFEYTSTRMTTQNKKSIVYGKFEMRAKLPYGQGIWPAFWLLGDNISQKGWPACGEIDIMEYIGRDPTHVHGSIHETGYDHSQTYYNADGFHNAFHTYSVNWQPNKIDYYVDEKLYGTDSSTSKWVFNNNPMFIILNLAVGGNWPGYPDSTTKFPQLFEIDYIRIYEMSGLEEKFD